MSSTPPSRRLLDKADTGARLLGHLLGHIDSFVDDIRKDSAAVARDSQQLFQLLQDRYRTVVDGASASPRAFRVGNRLLGIAARYRIEAGRSSVSTTRSDEHIEALHRWGATKVYEMCLQERGAILKLGQLMSMRPDLLPAAYVEELGKLRDQVPAVCFDEIRERIESELGAPLEELFREVCEEAVAAASLAQVHRATLKDGRPVALKVLVPSAEEQVRSDMALLRAVAAVLKDSELPFDAHAVLTQLAKSLEEERDYESEATHCEMMLEALATHPGVGAPRIYRELSTSVVLCMEWIEGEPIDRALPSLSPDEQRNTLETLCSSFVRQILREGIFHGDPHAGNILCDAKGHITLVDFGCVYRISDRERLGYRKLMQGLAMGHRETLLSSLVDLGFAADAAQAEALGDTVELMLGAFQDPQGLMRWAQDPRAATQDLLDAMKEAQDLHTPDHFVRVGRVLTNLAGLLIEYAHTGVALPMILVRELANDPAHQAQ